MIWTSEKELISKVCKVCGIIFKRFSFVWGNKLDMHKHLLSQHTRVQGNKAARRFFQTYAFIAKHKMTIRLDTEAGKHRAFKGETKLDN